jgi:hypothetical protein
VCHPYGILQREPHGQPRVRRLDGRAGLPVGDSMRGRAVGPPSTVEVRSRFSIAPHRGTKNQSSKLDRLRRSEASSSAPPSM